MPSPHLSRQLIVVGGLGVVCLTACGSGSGSAGNGDGGATSSGHGCQPVNLDGSVFGSKGTATLTGMGTLPDGIPDGLELELLVRSGLASIGVLPDNFLEANDRICGKRFQYKVNKIEAGTYTLIFEVFDTSSTSSAPVFEGTAPSDFTVTDGQMLNLDTTFQ